MARAELKVGDAWDSIEVLSVEYEVAVEIPLGNGLFSTSRDHRYTFWCDCRNEFQQCGREWRGKRALRDCGCGIHLSRGKKVMHSLYVPAILLHEIEKTAALNHLSVNYVIVKLLEVGLENIEKVEVSLHGSEGVTRNGKATDRGKEVQGRKKAKRADTESKSEDVDRGEKGGDETAVAKEG